MKSFQEFIQLLITANEQFPKCYQCNDMTRVKEIAVLWNSMDVSALNYSLIKRHQQEGLRYVENEEGHEYPVMFIYIDYNKTSNIFTRKKDESIYRIQITVADQYIADKENTDDIRTKHEIYFDTESILLKFMHLIGRSSYNDSTNQYEFNNDNSIGVKIGRNNINPIITPAELGSQKLIGAYTWIDIPIEHCIELICNE